MAQRERMKLYSFNAPEELLDAARAIAAAHGKTFSAVLRDLVETYVRLAGPPPTD